MNCPRHSELVTKCDPALGGLHALRHTFGTHLARAGVAPRVAMAAMRHCSLGLTMNVYTAPALLDVAGAVESLPGVTALNPSDHAHAPVTNAKSVAG